MKRFFYLTLCLFQSCVFFGTETEIVVSLPELPGRWGHHPEYRYLEYPAVEGITAQCVTLEQFPLEIRISKLKNIPVILRCEESRVSAGGVFPEDLDTDGVLHLSWVKGPLCEILLQCLEAGGTVDDLNVGKVQEELLSKGEGDPWSVDRDRIFRDLFFRNLTSRSFRKLPCHAIEVPAEQGVWLRGNPFHPLPVWEDGFLYLGPLPEGTWSFIHEDSGNKWVLSLDDKGWEGYSTGTGTVSSGRW
jgi:hypothetical protein